MLKIWRRALPCVLVVLVALTGELTAGADDRAGVLIRDAAVLEPSAGSWLTHRDIVIRNTTISAILPAGANPPSAKVVINGSGKFVIPGLFDNRVQLEDVSREAAGLFVAYGVTSVSVSGPDSPRVAEWRREIAYGKLMGPRIVDTAAGVRTANIPGSGAGTAGVTPGQGMHVELTRLVSSGLTPAAALELATIGSARAHARERDLGSIEIGKIADLLILDRDPLADIANTRAIDAVIFRGEALTRAHLNLLLSKSAAAARAK